MTESQDPKIEKVRRFIRLTRTEKLIETSIETLVGAFRSSFEEGFNEGLPDRAEQALAAINRALQANLGVLLDEIAVIYAERFEESELDALLAFYETPIGSKLIDIGVNLQDAVGKTTSAWSDRVIAGIDDELQGLLSVPTAELSQMYSTR